MNSGNNPYSFATRTEIYAQMTQMQTQEQPRSRHLPAPFFTTPNFSYVTIAPQPHNAIKTVNTLTSIWIPKPSANYSDRLTCVLLNHLQGDIQPYPQWSNGGIFNLPEAKRRQVYTAQIGKHEQLWINSGLISMPNLHHVQISIQISKVRQGDKYLYEIITRGTCYDEDDEALDENEKFLDVYMCVSWKMTSPNIPNSKNSVEDMSWRDLLKFLRRYAEVHYDEYGETRDQEDAETKDRQLGYALDWADCEYIGDRNRVSKTLVKNIAGHVDEDMEVEDDDDY